MDEMDHIQEIALASQEALLAERRKKIEFEASLVPPTYRLCDDCNCEIPPGRLRLKPLTRLCVDCQTEAENPRR